MTIISYEIENATIIDGAHNIVFSGFQRFSRFLTQLDRYQQLARQAQRVYVFGIADVTPPAIPNVTFVPLTSKHQLAKEWFVLSYGPDYFSALATEELTHFDDPDETRVFKGVWTFDKEMVSILYEWLCREVNDYAALAEEIPYRPQTHMRLISNSIGRLMQATVQQDSSPMHDILQGELKTIIKDGLYSALKSFSPEEAQPSLIEKNATILFTDLRDFTRLAQLIPARDLVEKIINPYIKTVTRIVYRYGGKVEKFLGDGVLAVFSESGPDDGGIRRALAAAMDILYELKKLPHQPPIGIGIDYGQVVVSQMGDFGAHVEETVIGDAVNTAQRLSGLGANDIYLTQRAAAYIQEPHLPIEPMKVELRGKAGVQSVYRMLM
jgi:class 3 adenylate cyclase/DICT domain-containing protein